MPLDPAAESRCVPATCSQRGHYGIRKGNGRSPREQPHDAAIHRLRWRHPEHSHVVNAVEEQPVCR